MAMSKLRRMMTALKLTVNEEKTRICRVPEESFDFLGYTFGRLYSYQRRRSYIGAKPSKKSIGRIIETIRIQTGRSKLWMEAEDNGADNQSKTERLGQLLQARSCQQTLQAD